MLPRIFAFGIPSLDVPETLVGVQTSKLFSTLVAAVLSVLVTGTIVGTIASVFLNS